MDFDFERVITLLPGVILGLTVHEFCHAWMAHLSGDSTSKDQGRVTLNPLKHIDPIGFLFLVIVGFGWAKPVQFNEENLRKKSDVIKIAFAGPASNAILAMILSFAYALIAPALPEYKSDLLLNVMDMFFYAIFINWGLFVFNLIPLPPLDGSHLLFFPLRKYPAVYNACYKYGSLLFFGLLLASFLTKINFLPISDIINYLTIKFLALAGYTV
jgi:Zn-dependent protease